MASEDEDEVYSDIEVFVEEDKEVGDDSRLNIFGKKKKRFKNSDNGSFSFFIKMLFIAVFIEVYFVINYILGDNSLF